MIFKDICRSFNVNEYKNFRKKTTGDVIAYIAVLLLICSIGIIIIPTIRESTKILSGFMQEIPEFEITQNGLTIDSTFDFDYAGIKMYATNERSVSAEDFGDDYMGFLLDRDKVILKSISQTAEFTYKEFDLSGSGFKVTKSDLPSLKKYIYIGLAVFDIMMYVALMFSYVLNSILAAVISNLISMLMHIRIPISQLIKLGIYSRTLPTVIFAFLGAVGFSMNTNVALLLSVAIMYMALRKIRADEGESTFEM